MRIGVPKEIKDQEFRVGLTPASVRELVGRGHSVLIEKNLGIGIGFKDSDYTAAGAKIAATAKDVFAKSDMIVKVKEPQASEYKLIEARHTVFTYLHLAAEPKLTDALVKSKCTAIAYETVTDRTGGLPLLAPMSDVAGRLSIQVGATALQKFNGGSGVLLGGVAGVSPARVLVIGAGRSGMNAARMAMGMEAQVTVMDKSLTRLAEINQIFGNRLITQYALEDTIAAAVAESDLVVGAVLIPGAAAPKLVTKKMLKTMRPGSVLVDISIDQGGCFETSRPTTHSNPTYVVDGIVHYCVTNMPAAVARTSALALNNATLPFVIALADKGAEQAMRDDPHLANGLNVDKGKIIHPALLTGKKKAA
jgi:alanine dehydrogenase